MLAKFVCLILFLNLVFGDPIVEHSLDTTRKHEIAFCFGECSTEEIRDHLTGRKNHAGRCGLSTYKQVSKRQWGISYHERTYRYRGQQEWTYSLAKTPTEMLQLVGHVSSRRAEFGVRVAKCEDFFDRLETAAYAVAVALGISAIVVSKGALTPVVKGLFWKMPAFADFETDLSTPSNSRCYWWNSKLPVGMELVLGYTSDTYNDRNAWYVRFSMPDSMGANTGRSFQLIFREIRHVGIKRGEVTCVQYTSHHEPQCFESRPAVC
ncbi:hypothetical protein GEMRC1_001068 [Eukaryota sp. GEM-RC1]